MNEILDGLKEALWLVVSFDPELLEISLRSLRVTLTALLVASAIAIPLGTYLAVQRFRYRRFVISLINARMGLPPVVDANRNDHRAGYYYHPGNCINRPPIHA